MGLARGLLDIVNIQIAKVGIVTLNLHTLKIIYMLFLSNLIYRREFNRAYAVSGIYPLMQVTNTPTHQLLSPFKNARQTLFDHLAWEDIRL